MSARQSTERVRLVEMPGGSVWLTLPPGILQALQDWKEGDRVELIAEPGRIVVRKA